MRDGPFSIPASYIPTETRFFPPPSISRIVGGNTNAPCIMIGERGAALVIEDWSEDSRGGKGTGTKNRGANKPKPKEEL